VAFRTSFALDSRGIPSFNKKKSSPGIHSAMGRQSHTSRNDGANEAAKSRLIFSNCYFAVHLVLFIRLEIFYVLSTKDSCAGGDSGILSLGYLGI
jgi:hypothetical protein